jgi:Na+/melibiose symporter-like transporter
MDASSSTSSPTTPDRSEPLLRSTVLIYGSIGLPLAVVGYPIAIWLIPHYSGVLGVSLAAVSTMLMLARITDVVTDPLIGEASDSASGCSSRRPRAWARSTCCSGSRS